PEEGNFHRTRLTHTLEVSQIVRGITLYLNNTPDPIMGFGLIDTSLIGAAALAHDLEDALSFKLITLDDFKDVMYKYKNSIKFSQLANRALDLDIRSEDYKLKLKPLFADLINHLILSISLKTNDSFVSKRLKFEAGMSEEGQA